MKHIFFHAVFSFILAVILPGEFSFAANKSPDENTYLSDTDKFMTIHRVAILPASDNVKGLYARYVEKKLSDLVRGTHRFDLVAIENIDPLTSFNEYESTPGLIQKIGKQAGVDCLLLEKVSKTKTGMEITLDLFLTTDGKLLAQENLYNEPKFEILDLERKNAELYSKILTKIPYRGMILSRQGNRVTLDMGSKDGLRPDMIISIEQIISARRHPKFNFLLSTEKEILGKVKIVKSDDALSFGIILQEKQKGVVRVDSKITNLDFVTYSEPGIKEEGLNPGAQKFLPKDVVSFGKNPKEWIPPKIPSLGKVGISLGLGSLHNNIVTQSGSYTSDVSLYPQLELTTEIWITQNWYTGLALSQGIFNISNPSSVSVPGNLGATNSAYELIVGYKVLLQDDFFGPQLNLHSGYGKYSFYVDASTPLTFTSVSYGGLLVGIGGNIPLTSDRSIYLDANLDRFLFPSLTETPLASGDSSSSSVTRFSLGGSFKLTAEFWIVAHLNFDFYSTNFSGLGSRPDPGITANQNLMTLLGGIEYLF